MCICLCVCMNARTFRFRNITTSQRKAVPCCVTRRNKQIRAFLLDHVSAECLQIKSRCNKKNLILSRARTQKNRYVSICTSTVRILLLSRGCSKVPIVSGCRFLFVIIIIFFSRRDRNILSRSPERETRDSRGIITI